MRRGRAASLDAFRGPLSEGADGGDSREGEGGDCGEGAGVVEPCLRFAAFLPQSHRGAELRTEDDELRTLCGVLCFCDSVAKRLAGPRGAART